MKIDRYKMREREREREGGREEGKSTLWIYKEPWHGGMKYMMRGLSSIVCLG